MKSVISVTSIPSEVGPVYPLQRDVGRSHSSLAKSDKKKSKLLYLGSRQPEQWVKLPDEIRPILIVYEYVQQHSPLNTVLIHTRLVKTPGHADHCFGSRCCASITTGNKKCPLTSRNTLILKGKVLLDSIFRRLHFSPTTLTSSHSRWAYKRSCQVCST